MIRVDMSGMTIPTAKRIVLVLTAGLAMLAGSGCIVIKPAAGAATAVAGAAVKGTAKVTTKVVGAAADAVVPDHKPSPTEPKAHD